MDYDFRFEDAIDRMHAMTYPQGPGFPPAPQFPGAQPPAQFPGVPQGQGLPQFPTEQPGAEQVATGSVDGFLSGGAKAISFGNANTGYKRMGKPFGGKVVSSKTAPVTDINTRAVKRWDDGRVREQLVVTIDTLSGPYPERDDANDDGKRTVYIKGAMVKVFREAIQAGNGGGSHFPNGGMLLGCHTGTTPAKNGGVQYLWSFLWDPNGNVPANVQDWHAAATGGAQQAATTGQPVYQAPAPAQQYQPPFASPAPYDGTGVAAVPAPPAPPVPTAPALPPEWAAAGWTAEQYAQHMATQAQPPAPPAQSQLGAGHNPFMNP